jgi:subtilase family serine protease
LIALQNLLNASSTPPALVSISYGECEAENGAAANAAYNATYEQAAAEGVSVFVSAGDEGAASCDADESKSTHGIGVSGFASTPYNVAVGGTDFGDAYAGTESTYWNPANTSTYGSAKSYIPEIPWNDSCASALLSSYEGYSTTYGSSGFCNSATGKEYFLTTASGSGGPSGCATGSASTSGVVSGTCKGYAKPGWQSLVGVPNDGVRDLPDVSLFAANGVWGHYYVFCYSDRAGGGAPCTGAPSGWAGAGGTSFASPILAGMQALVNQKWGRQGNPNPIYYQIAAAEYGASGNAACNSGNGNGVASSCVFYDVTQGDMDINCTGSHNCYLPSGKNGVLSTSNTSYAPAFKTGTGWDFATGIGTVNAYNLVLNSSW